MTTIHIKGLQVDDGRQTLLQALDLTLLPGSALTLIGESGSGKSLLAHALMGTLPAPLRGRGEMAIGGLCHSLADPQALRALWGRELAMLPQEPVLALDPTMGLLPQVEEGWLAGGKEARSRARDALERLGLAGRERHFPHQLSGGLLQRAAIAAALACRPALVIADEPTSSLDPTMVTEVLNLIEEITRAHRTTLLVTHEVRFARKVASRILFIDQGRIIANTTDVEGFFDRPPTPAIADFLSHVHR